MNEQSRPRIAHGRLTAAEIAPPEISIAQVRQPVGWKKADQQIRPASGEIACDLSATGPPLQMGGTQHAGFHSDCPDFGADILHYLAVVRVARGVDKPDERAGVRRIEDCLRVSLRGVWESCRHTIGGGHQLRKPRGLDEPPWHIGVYLRNSPPLVGEVEVEPHDPSRAHAPVWLLELPERLPHAAREAQPAVQFLSMHNFLLRS